MYLEGLLREGVLYPKRIFCEWILYPEEILREGVLSQEGYFRRDYASELILDEGILSKWILTQR